MIGGDSLTARHLNVGERGRIDLRPGTGEVVLGLPIGDGAHCARRPATASLSRIGWSMRIVRIKQLFRRSQLP